MFLREDFWLELDIVSLDRGEFNLLSYVRHQMSDRIWKKYLHISHIGGIREDDSKRNLPKSESDSDASESNRNLNSDKEILPDHSIFK